ncbi:hypothetical protein [Streptomyces sp. NPDC059761]|uniref:hypothetical protein n=1 Tax=Streptomyces sp. NPDC059761 TaxID=3346937 RepID=UPI003653B1AE
MPSDREGAERRVRADRRDHSRLVGALGRLDAARPGRARVLDRAAALHGGRPGPLTPDSHGIHVPPPPWGYGPHEA